MGSTLPNPPAVGEKVYNLKGAGPKLIIIKGDITGWPQMLQDRDEKAMQQDRADKSMQQDRADKVTAVVNSANQRLCGGGGVDGKIHRAAGPKPTEECLRKPEIRPGIRCPTGEAVITRGHNFGSTYIIHTCGPVYVVDEKDECEKHLKAAYINTLKKVQQFEVKRVAFPAISTGVYAFPFEAATRVSLTVLNNDEVPASLEEVWIVLFTEHDFLTAIEVAKELGLEEYKQQSEVPEVLESMTPGTVVQEAKDAAAPLEQLPEGRST